MGPTVAVGVVQIEGTRRERVPSDGGPRACPLIRRCVGGLCGLTADLADAAVTVGVLGSMGTQLTTLRPQGRTVSLLRQCMADLAQATSFLA